MRTQVGAYRVLVISLLAYFFSASFAPPIFAQDEANQFQPSVVLPRPEPKFKGRIGITYKDSQPDKIPIIKAPEGAPNVLLTATRYISRKESRSTSTTGSLRHAIR